jgi:hypothetical protein
MMDIEKYSCYEFQVRKYDGKICSQVSNGWDYVIYDPDYKPCELSIIRESQEWFDSEQQARYAAIGHITLLENGEG